MKIEYMCVYKIHSALWEESDILGLSVIEKLKNTAQHLLRVVFKIKM
jgi:hypothetical protein